MPMLTTRYSPRWTRYRRTPGATTLCGWRRGVCLAVGLMLAITPMTKILIMGLPGAGKTTLARILALRLGGVHFEADQVRANVNKDLGFSHEDRVEQARRMGWLCDRVAAAGCTAIADFVCPLNETRAAFGPAFTVWVDRISEGRFEDTNRMFEPPHDFDIRVTADGAPEYWVERVAAALSPTFDPKRPTAL